jgi:head-tail adaptor
MRGKYRFRTRVETPGAPLPDGDGGFVEQWTPVTVWWCDIEPATVRNQERLVSNTIAATATHVLSGDYHPGITTLCRLWVPDLEQPTIDRRYDISSVQRVHGLRRYLVVGAVEYLAERDPRPVVGGVS